MSKPWICSGCYIEFKCAVECYILKVFQIIVRFILLQNILYLIFSSNTHNLLHCSETMLHALREQTYDPPHQNQRLFCETRYSILRYVISRYLCHIIISTFRYSTTVASTVPTRIRIHKIFPIFFHFVCSDHFSILKNIWWYILHFVVSAPNSIRCVVLNTRNIKSP